VTLGIWILAAYQFFAWWAEEQREERQSAQQSSQQAAQPLPAGLTWADVEHQLAQVPPPRP
jgi:hypothetical protein